MLGGGAPTPILSPQPHADPNLLQLLVSALTDRDRFAKEFEQTRALITEYNTVIAAYRHEREAVAVERGQLEDLKAEVEKSSTKLRAVQEKYQANAAAFDANAASKVDSLNKWQVELKAQAETQDRFAKQVAAERTEADRKIAEAKRLSETAAVSLQGRTWRTLSATDKYLARLLSAPPTIISITPEGQQVAEVVETFQDDRKPVVGQVVLYFPRPGERKMARAMFPALVTAVDREAVSLTWLVNEDESHDTRCFKRTPENPWHAWDFTDCERELYQRVKALETAMAEHAKALQALLTQGVANAKR